MKHKRHGSLAFSPRGRTSEVIVSLKQKLKTYRQYFIKLHTIRLFSKKYGYICVTVARKISSSVIRYVKVENNKQTNLTESNFQNIDNTDNISVLKQYKLSDIKLISRKKPFYKLVPYTKKTTFNNDEPVTIVAISKGYGFNGPVKRWHIKLKKRKHARAKKTRHIGCVSPEGFHKISWHAPMPGQKGHWRRQIKNIKVLTDDYMYNEYFASLKFKYNYNQDDIMFFKGSIPGPKFSIFLASSTITIDQNTNYNEIDNTQYN